MKENKLRYTELSKGKLREVTKDRFQKLSFPGFTFENRNEFWGNVLRLQENTKLKFKISYNLLTDFDNILKGKKNNKPNKIFQNIIYRAIG